MVGLGVRELAALRLGVALGVRVAGLVPVGDAVGERLRVLAGVGVREPVPLGVSVRGAVRVAAGDALPEPLRRLATLSPRYVSRATTASGVSPPPPPLPPPPPAASHSSADSRMPLAMMLTGTSWLMLAYRKQLECASPAWRLASMRREPTSNA